MFTGSELSRKKRPDTAASQFKTSLAQLVDILVSKEPSYIRCIKPNDVQKPGLFEKAIVTHQVCMTLMTHFKKEFHFKLPNFIR